MCGKGLRANYHVTLQSSTSPLGNSLGSPMDPGLPPWILCYPVDPGLPPWILGSPHGSWAPPMDPGLHRGSLAPQNQFHNSSGWKWSRVFLLSPPRQEDDSPAWIRGIKSHLPHFGDKARPFLILLFQIPFFRCFA